MYIFFVSFRGQKTLGPRPDRSPFGGLIQNFRRPSPPLSYAESLPPPGDKAHNFPGPVNSSVVYSLSTGINVRESTFAFWFPLFILKIDIKYRLLILRFDFWWPLSAAEVDRWWAKRKMPWVLPWKNWNCREQFEIAVSKLKLPWTIWAPLGSKGGAVVGALASHQCGPGSNPGVDAICGLRLLLVLSFAPRGFSPGTPLFPSPKKPTFPNSNSTRNQVDEEPLCGCATCKSLSIYLVIYLNCRE